MAGKLRPGLTGFLVYTAHSGTTTETGRVGLVLSESHRFGLQLQLSNTIFAASVSLKTASQVLAGVAGRLHRSSRRSPKVAAISMFQSAFNASVAN